MKNFKILDNIPILDYETEFFKMITEEKVSWGNTIKFVEQFK